MNTASSNYEQTLISGWEATYKQGQLTLWIFLALYESPKTLTEIKEYLSNNTGGTLVADDMSLYRSLRRYYDTEMVETSSVPSNKGGPPVNKYNLSNLGEKVLKKFTKRNISKLVNNNQIKEII